jgi:transketolase
MPTGTAAIDTTLLANLARTIRGLAIDGVEKANSGHPGLPLGCADFAALLWHDHLRYDPADPKWPDRDRFVLSAGHGSMLLYAMLHLTGYDVSLDDLKNFRQLHSKTPGHPENFMTAGVETTTGPLGQGFAMAVGLALASHMMADRFPGLLEQRVYAVVSDGDLMEGVAAEAASLAGHLRLGRIVFFYDDNDISLDGPTSLSFTGEDVAKRFEAYGWHVVKCDGHDFASMHAALNEAKADPRPSLVVGKTIIGYGSPNKQGKSASHGSPLGPEEVRATKRFHGLPEDKDFFIAPEDVKSWRARAAQGAATHKDWKAKFAALPAEQQAAFRAHLEKKISAGDLAAVRPTWEPGKSEATRKSAGIAQNAYAKVAPWLVGGSADLDSSTNTALKGSPDVRAGDYSGRNIRYGVREFAMAAISNGLSLSGFFRPFCATFFTFSDYMKPAIRLATLMHVPAIYVFTHDSIFLGEDGPTHQPVEHLAALRAVPNLVVLRPADAEESALAWETALQRTEGPTAIVLSRQNLPIHDRKAKGLAAADGLARGAYVLRDAKDAKVVLIATGSEVALALQASEALEKEGIGARVVSMPSWELFRAQDKAHRDAVLPPAIKARVVVEAGVRQGWAEWAGEHAAFVTQDGFGASAPAEDLAKEFGFTVEAVVAKAKGLLGA